ASVGLGGARAAVACALIVAERAALAVADTDKERRLSLIERLAARAPVAVRTGTADAAGFDLVVNATPAGMQRTDPLPVDAARLEPSAYVADLITRPALTPLLEAA